MDDNRRRTEFANGAIQIQAVEKLVRDVRKKLLKGGCLSSATTELPEITSLWQYTSVSQNAVARYACQQWVQLLKEGAAEFTYVLNGLLNQVPTAKNLQGIVEAVFQLLTLQVLLIEKAGESYKCPYTIRSPPHPLVTIVTNRPAESWPLIVAQISAVMNHGTKSLTENALAMLDPFLKFVLLDPKGSDQHLTLRFTLQNTLVLLVPSLQGSELGNSWLSYLLDILMKQQVSSFQRIAETVHFCLQLLHVYAKQSDDLDRCHGNKLCTVALSLCLKSLHVNLDFSSLAGMILTIGKQDSKVLIQPISVAVLAQLLQEAFPADRGTLLSILRIILKSPQVKTLSPVTVGFVAMAAINATSNVDQSNKTTVALATEVISLMDRHIEHEEYQEVRNIGNQSDQLTPEIYDLQTCVQLVNQLCSNAGQLHRWLTNLHNTMSSLKTVSWGMVNLLVSILLTTKDTDIARLTINRLTDVAKQEVAKAPSLLPLFLYCLGKKTCPKLRLHLMEALPRLATHKYTVPTVLKTVLSLGQLPKLKALSVRLLTQLWVQQDRCFPHLLNAITDSWQSNVTMTTVTDDLTLAKALAIKEVCRLRPEQHGSDMLSPLSQILNTCTDMQTGTAAALAMEGLYYICEAEVIDIMSAWRVLEKNMSAEKRIPVIEKICDLLSLVPSLQVKTDEYEKFLSEMVWRLWLYTQTNSLAVVTAAYQALSFYSVEHFKISFFKFQIVEEFVTQAQTILAQEGNEGETIDSVMPFVPGICYIRLMKSIDRQALDGFETFLSSIIGKEVESLPRGIYHTSKRQHGASTNQGKAVGTIPKFIQMSYEKTKQPGLRPGLAAALLFCYDPPVEVGRDGRPRKHYIMSHGKSYQQMFNTLLHDIPLQPSEWHRMILMPQAWASFIDRLFNSMLEAREAEIDLQLKRDFVTETEADDMRAAAWLWVRDTVFEIIKRATKGNPSIQGNAILALAGLTMAVQRLAASLDKAERKRADDITEHTSHAHWVMMVIDSCMSLVDNEFQLKSSLIGLCQQRAVDDRLPASVLAQAMALLALCQMVPVIISSYTELVYTLMSMLTERLPGQPKSEECPQVLHMFHGLGLGVLLSKLVQESFPDLSGSKGTLAVMSALDVLEECCFSKTDQRSGAVLGLGIGLAALCRDGKIESRVHVSSVHKKLQDLLKNTAPTEIVYQPLCYALTTITGTGFVCNAIDIETANSTLGLLTNLLGNSKENQGVALSLGMLCHSLSLGGHPTIDNQKHQLLIDWIQSAHKGDSPAMERLASLAGLLALVGSENCVQRIEGDFSAASSDLKIDKVIAEACQIITNSDHVGIQGSASWLLGNLYMSLCSTNTSSSTVPVNYQYLQESSVLRYVTDFLSQAGKQGPELVPSRYVEICLTALQKEVSGSLPPLNWTGVLSPLMKLQFGDEVKLLCVKLTLKLCTSSPTAAMFLASWIVPPLFTTLPESSQMAIFEASNQLIKSVTPSVLQTFFNKSCTEVFQTKNQTRTLQASVLRGVNSALMVADPPEAVVAMLYKFVQELFQLMEAEKDPMLLSGLAKCLGRLPEAIFDELTSGDCINGDSIVRGTFVRSYLVGHGHQPIALLNSCIDAAFNISCNHSTVLYYLMHAFVAMTNVDSKNTRLMVRAQWLLEIMGHVRNIMTGAVQLTNAQADKQLVACLGLDIISAAMCVWTGPQPFALFDVTSDLFNMDNPSQISALAPNESHLASRPLDLLRGYIQMLDQDPWNQLVPKVLDWLMLMQDWIPKERKVDLNSCLSSFRNSSDFAKAAVWTKAVMC